MASGPVSAIVLAAGDGRRMRSARPKPLHRLCGRPMIRFVVEALESLDLERLVVVVGHGRDRIASELLDTKPHADLVDQRVRRGTGDAVLAGLSAFADDLDVFDDGEVLVVPADMPLLRHDELEALVAAHRAGDAAATVLTAHVDDPGWRMRVVRGGRDESIVRVVDHRDTVGHERTITEVATGVWCFRRSLLAPALRRVEPDNAAGEIHVGGVVEVLASTGHRVGAHATGHPDDALGINDRVELSRAEAELRRRTNRAWLARGVTMLDPERTYVDATVELAPDVTLFPGTILQGATVVGEGSEIGPDTRLVDTEVGPGCRVEKTMAERAVVGADSHVGPFAVLSPGASLATATVTGPFYTSGADAL
mgnify:CR=1 FL=1